MARKRVKLGAEYGLSHANGRRLISQDMTQAQAVTLFPSLDQWNRLIMGRPASWIMGLTWGSASALDGVWQGHGGGFNPGVLCTSRNLIEFPDGWFDINYTVPISYGGVVGQGTNIATNNGNNTTFLVADNARWIGDLNMPVMRSVNWGTSTYLESALIDNFRIYGSGPAFLDPSYWRSGIEISTMGETCRIGTVYVSDCNGHNIHVNGSGPGKIDHISAFDSNMDGLFHSGASSLGSIMIGQLSGDNNRRCLYRNELAGAFDIAQIKAETGLSNSRGKPFSAQNPVYLKGWVAGHIGLLSSAVTGHIDSLIHFWSTANGSYLKIDTVVGWNHMNLATNLRTGKRYYKAPSHLNLNFRAHPVEIWALGTAFRITTIPEYDPMTEGDFGGTERLGTVTDPSEYNFAAGTPPFSATGGGPTPPPPTPIATTVTVLLTPASVTGTSTSQATAVVQDQFGSPMANSGSWELVSGPGTINSSGLITPNGTAGSIVVRYVQGSANGLATLTVTAAAPSIPDQVYVTLSAGTVTAPATVQASAQVLDQFGNLMPLAGAWTIQSGPATISSQGVITPTGTAGTAVVRYTQGSRFGEATLSIQAAVVPPPVLTPLYSITFAGQNILALPGCQPISASRPWVAGSLSGATYSTYYTPTQSAVSAKQVLSTPIPGVKRIVLKQAVIKEAVQYKFLNNDVRVNGNRQFISTTTPSYVIQAFVPNAPKADITLIFQTPQTMETLFGALSSNNTLWLECEGLEFWAQ
jgi:hypothetical protein